MYFKFKINCNFRPRNDFYINKKYIGINYFFGLRASDIVLDDSGFQFIVDLAEISGSETILHLHHDNLKFVSLINLQLIKTRYHIRDSYMRNISFS